MDPNGVDPFLLRLSALGLLWIAVCSLPAARPQLPLALSVTAIILPYSCYLAGPSLAARIGWSSPALSLGLGGILELCTTLALLAALLATNATPGIWRRISLRRILPYGTGLAGCVVLTLILLLVPAVPLGRLGIATLSLHQNGWGYLLGDGFQGIAQEIAFRAMLLSVLERSMSRSHANLLQAGIFSLAHLAVQYEGPSLPLLPLTLLLGLLLGWITQKLESVWAAAIIHGFLDVAIDIGILPGLYGG